MPRAVFSNCVNGVGEGWVARAKRVKVGGGKVIYLRVRDGG